MTIETPAVYAAVRAVGTLRPRFNPALGQGFSNELNVVGTGFWLKDYKILLTCAHVVFPLLGAAIETTGLLVVGNAGNYRRATINCLDLAHDLAVLALVGNNNEPISGDELANEAATGLILNDHYEPVSTPVAYAGFPLGLQLLNALHSPTYAEGVIGVEKRDGVPRKEIQISGSVMGGYSGSPVVLRDEPDKVIGAVSNGPSVAGQTGDIFMAISWEHVGALAKLATS